MISDSFAAEIKLSDKFFFPPKPSFSHIEIVSFILLGFTFEYGSQFINYAISRQVQDLNVHIPEFVMDLSTFSSTSMKKLKMSLDFVKVFRFSDCWDLPALTTLRLILPSLSLGGISIPEL